MTVIDERGTAKDTPPQYRGVPAPRPAPAASVQSGPPRLADGIDLIGEYEGSGYKEPHYLARRKDGQVVQLSHLLYLVADNADGQRDAAAIAEQVSEEYDKTVSADNVETLLGKLRPLGVIASNDPDEQPQVLDPLLALRFKTGVVPERVVNAITTVFHPLFFPPVIVAAIAAFIALDVWLFFRHGIAQGMRETMYNPALFLLIFGFIVVGAAFHEIGHAVGCKYGGARPGVMGAGVYVAWPAFYTDVTDAYRLGKAGRLRTDLGGVYFNIVYCLGLAALYGATRFEPLLLVIAVQQIEIVHQLLPFLRLDGYYIVADLTGVPDLFLRMKPILKSALPGSGTDERVEELKPWVRVAVTTWVLVVVPVLLFNLGLILMHFPRMVGTALDSLHRLWDQIGPAWSSGGYGTAGAGVVQALLLTLPIVGLVYTFARIGQRGVMSAWHWSSGSVPRRALVTVLTASLLGGLGYAWWPSRDYQPIRRDERGTFQESVAVVTREPGERTGVRPKREPLGGVPGYVGEPTPTTTPSPDATPSPDPSPSPSGDASASTTPDPDPSATPLDPSPSGTP